MATPRLRPQKLSLPTRGRSRRLQTPKAAAASARSPWQGRAVFSSPEKYGRGVRPAPTANNHQNRPAPSNPNRDPSQPLAEDTQEVVSDRINSKWHGSRVAGFVERWSNAKDHQLRLVDRRGNRYIFDTRKGTATFKKPAPSQVALGCTACPAFHRIKKYATHPAMHRSPRISHSVSHIHRGLNCSPGSFPVITRRERIIESSNRHIFAFDPETRSPRAIAQYDGDTTQAISEGTGRILSKEW